ESISNQYSAFHIKFMASSLLGCKYKRVTAKYPAKRTTSIPAITKRVLRLSSTYFSVLEYTSATFTAGASSDLFTFFDILNCLFRNAKIDFFRCQYSLDAVDLVFLQNIYGFSASQPYKFQELCRGSIRF